MKNVVTIAPNNAFIEYLTFFIPLPPVNNVGEKVVVPEPVVDVDLLVVDRQRSRVDAPLLSQQKVSFRDFRPVRL